MKKILTILLLTAMSAGAANALPVKHHHKYVRPHRHHKVIVHIKKDGTPDKRYKENR
jgi:hypothetical protein